MTWRLSELAGCVRGQMIGSDVSFERVGTDSRTLEQGSLFVALQGPNFDGHDFAAAAIERGAVALLVARRLDVAVPQVVVGDPLAALSEFARDWRRRFRIPLIGVTGSNGKTTTKELIGSILSRVGPTLVTRGNLNNHIGVPLTLLGLTPEHRYAVIEMGANHPGEIAHLCAIAEPTIGVVTNAGAAHLEGFGTLENVARSKGELFRSLPIEGVSIINADDVYAPLWRELSSADRILTFGFEQPADFTAHRVSVTAPIAPTLPSPAEAGEGKKEGAARAQVSSAAEAGEGKEKSAARAQVSSAAETGEGKKEGAAPSHVPSPASGGGTGWGPIQFELVTPYGNRQTTLSLVGLHNLRNALAAAAAACAAGAELDEIAAGLASMKSVAGRLELKPAINGAFLVDDSYNANPSSLKAGLDAFRAFEGPRWLVLGEMRELGDNADALHAEVGRYARQSGVERLLAVGEGSRFAVEAFGPGAHWFADVDALIAEARQSLRSGVTVLVKGSRANRLERVTAALGASPGQGAGDAH